MLKIIPLHERRSATLTNQRERCTATRTRSVIWATASSWQAWSTWCFTGRLRAPTGDTWSPHAQLEKYLQDPPGSSRRCLPSWSLCSWCSWCRNPPLWGNTYCWRPFACTTFRGKNKHILYFICEKEFIMTIYLHSLHIFSFFCIFFHS